MKLIHVPIELLEERYSKQWYEWFNREFIKHKINAINVLPPSGVEAKIQTGEFLDVIGTLEFKSEQLRWICSLFRDGTIDKDTVFLFADAWYPGLESLAYLRDALQIPFKMVGIFHAGTWDEHDFITKKGMRSWGQFCERAWFEILDGVCVATHFHKKLITESLTPYVDFTEYDIIKNKIHVTGLPIYPDFVSHKKVKQNLVVFPHRLADEKNPQMFDQLRDRLQHAFPLWQFIKTKDRAKTKQEYYDILNQAKVAVSFADQETYGIATLEAVLCGCIPIVPDKLSYKELYPQRYKYAVHTDMLDAATARVQNVLTNINDYQENLQQFKNEVQWMGGEAIDNILKICLEICNE